MILGKVQLTMAEANVVVEVEVVEVEESKSVFIIYNIIMYVTLIRFHVIRVIQFPRKFLTLR